MKQTKKKEKGKNVNKRNNIETKEKHWREQSMYFIYWLCQQKANKQNPPTLRKEYPDTHGTLEASDYYS